MVQSEERGELLGALNELLEAERAGTRIAFAGRKAAPTPRVGHFMDGLRGDEARWCGMLARQIERLGGSPSTRCGAFYEKVMAIDDPLGRLVLLNKGQIWVVRRLEALMPRVDDEELRAELQTMAESHVENVAKADQLIALMRGGSEAGNA